MAESKDSFASRWSRRKQARRRETREPDKAQVAPKAPDDAAPAPCESTASDELVAALPDVETLTEESDFTVFFQQGVPEALRRKALSRLWRLNPVFANLDGLNDYDEDFTLATSALQGVVKTVYQVGKGMVDPDEPETTPGTADDAGSSENARTAEISSQDRALERREEESSSGPAVDDGEAADAAEHLPVEPSAAATTRAAIEPAGAAAKTSAAERRWGRFKGS